MPKAAYSSSHRHKHNRPRWDSNLGPLTPQAYALTTTPLRPANNKIPIQTLCKIMFATAFIYCNKLKKLIMQSLMYGKFPDYVFTTVTKYFSAFSFRITQFRILPTPIYRYGSIVTFSIRRPKLNLQQRLVSVQRCNICITITYSHAEM